MNPVGPKEKEMSPELAAVIASHKPRGLTFPSPKKPLKTLEEEFGPEVAAKIRHGAKLAQLKDPTKEKPES